MMLIKRLLSTAKNRHHPNQKRRKNLPRKTAIKARYFKA